MISLNTNKGTIVISLDFEKTPNTAANFLEYARSNFYDNTLFHRVVKGFVIQGGGLTADMSEKETRAPIENEANQADKNKRGTLSMARTGMPHSASSQFFINLKDNHFLDFTRETPDGWGYCVFGEVTEGMDVVDAIAAVNVTTKRHYQDVPEDDIIIESVDINVEALPESVQSTLEDNE